MTASGQGLRNFCKQGKEQYHDGAQRVLYDTI